ncbi:hypothetical protein GQ44DRAFT_701496 [Phaeosphaeriaceae sp. PMI808]|nr:hypothetical protein GQ44DRAFT_701496 [Phaeosphaeriaceae sp. PMI808]
MGGKFVDAPKSSIHSGHSFCVGTSMFHKGIFRHTLQGGEIRQSMIWKMSCVLVGIGYINFMLVHCREK